MRKLLIAAAISTAGLTAAGCDPYYHGGPGVGPGAYPDPGAPGGYAPAPGQVVSALGCPIPGVEPACLSFRSVDGATFDISSAQARPDPRSPFAVEVSGRISTAMSYCQQGAILEEVQVRQTHLRCVAGVIQGQAAPAY